MNPPPSIVRFLAVVMIVLGAGGLPASHAQEYLWPTIAGSIGGPGIKDGVGPEARFFHSYFA